jgi:hypothetical protein
LKELIFFTKIQDEISKFAFIFWDARHKIKRKIVKLMYTMVVTKLNLPNVIHVVNQLMQYPSNMEHWMVTKKKSLSKYLPRIQLLIAILRRWK